MKKSLSWFGIGTAVLLIAACANPQRITSGIDDDSPRMVSGAPVAAERPGSEGPVADYSRLAINHRDVAAREQRARERLAKAQRDRMVVTDNTVSSSSAPVISEPVRKETVKKHKAKKKMARAQHHAPRVVKDSTRMRSAAPARMIAPAPESVLIMKREVVLNQLHHVNQKEIAMARLVKTRASDQGLKTAANRIVADHERLENRVKEVARRRNVTLAKFQPNTYEGVTLEKMEDLTGRNFDYAFDQEIRDGHRFTAAELRVLRNRVGDPEITALIDETLPVLTRQTLRTNNALGAIQTNRDYSAQNR